MTYRTPPPMGLQGAPAEVQSSCPSAGNPVDVLAEMYAEVYGSPESLHAESARPISTTRLPR